VLFIKDVDTSNNKEKISVDILYPAGEPAEAREHLPNSVAADTIPLKILMGREKYS
jgi:hypothetical protein